MTILINRSLSATIAIVYLIGAYLGGGPATAVGCAIYLLLPLACIWFCDEMGDFTGVMRGQLVTSKSPGCLVAAGGWVLLLLPVILAVVHQLRQQS